MGLLDDQLAQDFTFNTDADLMPGVETLTFRKTDGTTFSRAAHVYRYSVKDEAGRLYQPMLIGLPNDATNGIASDEFDEGGWQVSLDYRGETATWRKLVRPADGREDHDPSWCWFEVR